MRATVLKIVENKSKYGSGKFYYIFMKSLDKENFGKSFRTCIGDDYRNFHRWQGIKPGMVLEGLNLIRPGNQWIVDADSYVEIVGYAEHEPDTYMIK